MQKILKYCSVAGAVALIIWVVLGGFVAVKHSNVPSKAFIVLYFLFTIAGTIAYSVFMYGHLLLGQIYQKRLLKYAALWAIIITVMINALSMGWIIELVGFNKMIANNGNHVTYNSPEAHIPILTIED